MVGQSAALLMKKVVAFAQSLQKRIRRLDLYIGRLSQAGEPLIVALWFMECEGLVRPKSGQHPRADSCALDAPMRCQVIHWIVCGAKSSHSKLLQDSLRGELRSLQPGIGLFPDSRCV